MGSAWKATEEVAHAFINESLAPDGLFKAVEFGGGWQVAVQDEEGGFQEGRVLGKLFNGVSAVAQNAVVAVDVGDLGFARSGVDESGVKHDVAGAPEQTSYVIASLTIGGLNLWKVEILVIVDKTRGLGHDIPFRGALSLFPMPGSGSRAQLPHPLPQPRCGRRSPPAP